MAMAKSKTNPEDAALKVPRPAQTGSLDRLADPQTRENLADVLIAAAGAAAAALVGGEHGGRSPTPARRLYGASAGGLSCAGPGAAGRQYDRRLIRTPPRESASLADQLRRASERPKTPDLEAQVLQDEAQW